MLTRAKEDHQVASPDPDLLADISVTMLRSGRIGTYYSDLYELATSNSIFIREGRKIVNQLQNRCETSSLCEYDYFKMPQ